MSSASVFPGVITFTPVVFDVKISTPSAVFAQEDLNVVGLVDADGRRLVGDLDLHIGAVHHIHRGYDRVDH